MDQSKSSIVLIHTTRETPFTFLSRTFPIDSKEFCDKLIFEILNKKLTQKNDAPFPFVGQNHIPMFLIKTFLRRHNSERTIFFLHLEFFFSLSLFFFFFEHEFLFLFNGEKIWILEMRNQLKYKKLQLF